MSRFDEQNFDSVERLEHAEPGVQYGYMDFSAGWEDRVDPNDLAATTELDVRQISPKTIGDTQLALDSIWKKHRDR